MIAPATKGDVFLVKVLCKTSNTANDVRCTICGQGFLVYWTQTPAAEIPSWRTEIAAALRGHHSRGEDAHVHPTHSFMLPVGQPNSSAAEQEQEPELAGV